ncbi:putative defense protein 1 [Lytechinus variegatus]|uniref:putative defense protein 1 n=1 Tax=Lytechinus variegatus TaxID=7654 RepID=UPI001BB10C10|nr:putative defense protein 1 [Lytechinus variegatus]
MKSSMISTVLLSMAMSVVIASPNGPPVSVPGLCEDMVPSGHGSSDATGDAPYTITAVKQTDNTYTVRIEGVDNSTFRGFFIQARPWDSSSSSESETTSLGVFSSQDTVTKPLDCFGSTANAWGHSINNNKTSVEGTWSPPAGSGEVRFRMTVVQGPASTYWTELYSDVIMYGSDTTMRMTTSSSGKSSLSLASFFGSLLVFLFTNV